MTSSVDEGLGTPPPPPPAGGGGGDGGEEAPPPTPPPEIRSLILTGFGGLKSLRAMAKPPPTLDKGQVLVRASACGMNFQDLMVRQGAIDSTPKTPFIMGFECAGVIEQISEGVDKFQIGDRVIALPEYGAWAELVAVPAEYVYPIPDEMSFTDAAAIAVNYIVAYILLFEIAKIRPGNSILIHSAGGGVGHAIAQLSKTVEDTKLYGVASKHKHEHLTSIDYLIERGTDYISEIRKTSPDGIDVVLDCLCGEDCNKGMSIVKPMGTYVLYGSANIITGETKSFFSAARSWWQVDKFSPIKLFDENKTVSGLNLRHLLFLQNKSNYIASIMEKIIDLWKKGKIKPTIDSTWALEDVPEAMQKMHDRTNVGKIVIDLKMEPKPKNSTPAKGKQKENNKEDKKKEEVNGSVEEKLESPEESKNKPNSS